MVPSSTNHTATPLQTSTGFRVNSKRGVRRKPRPTT